MNRDQLISRYAEHVIDGMDMDTLVVFATDTLRDDMRKWDFPDLLEDVRSYAPHLLEDFNDE
jgi:hypothetical protein